MELTVHPDDDVLSAAERFVLQSRATASYGLRVSLCAAPDMQAKLPQDAPLRPDAFATLPLPGLWLWRDSGHTVLPFDSCFRPDALVSSWFP